jgi:UDP-glucuronate 4-epimerase
MKFLVTGSAGFIGSYTCKALIEQGHDVVGLDNMNSYYDPALKVHRLEHIVPKANFQQATMDIADREGIAKLFKEEKFDRVIHLGAQAGVRCSI